MMIAGEMPHQLPKISQFGPALIGSQRSARQGE